MMLPVLAVPVDEDNQPIGHVFEMVTHDVASTSIGLFHEASLTAKRPAIQLVLAGIQVKLILQVIWKSPMRPFYGSAGWYREKLNRFPGDSLPCGQ